MSAYKTYQDIDNTASATELNRANTKGLNLDNIVKRQLTNDGTLQNLKRLELQKKESDLDRFNQLTPSEVVIKQVERKKAEQELLETMDTAEGRMSNSRMQTLVDGDWLKWKVDNPEEARRMEQAEARYKQSGADANNFKISNARRLNYLQQVQGAYLTNNNIADAQSQYEYANKAYKAATGKDLIPGMNKFDETLMGHMGKEIEGLTYTEDYMTRVGVAETTARAKAEAAKVAAGLKPDPFVKAENEQFTFMTKKLGIDLQDTFAQVGMKIDSNGDLNFKDGLSVGVEGHARTASEKFLKTATTHALRIDSATKSNPAAMEMFTNRVHNSFAGIVVDNDGFSWQGDEVGTILLPKNLPEKQLKKIKDMSGEEALKYANHLNNAVLTAITNKLLIRK